MDPGFVLALTVACCAALATYVTLRLNSATSAIETKLTKTLNERDETISKKLEDRHNAIIYKLDELRRDFSSGFVSTPIASEQQKNVMFRLENAEREVAGVRERTHMNAQAITQMGFTIGEVKAHSERVPTLLDQMSDKARRLASVESKVGANEDMLHDHANRIHELERADRK